MEKLSISDQWDDTLLFWFEKNPGKKKIKKFFYLLLSINFIMNILLLFFFLIFYLIRPFILNYMWTNLFKKSELNWSVIKEEPFTFFQYLYFS